MILLDIPQGVVTLASAVLAAVITVAGSFGIVAVGVALSFQRRLTALEAEVRELRNNQRESRVPYPRNIDPPGNPMQQERWDELTKKLNLDLLSDDEAQELHAAFVQRHKQAREENDKVTMVLMRDAMRATEVQIHLAEIRNTPWWQNLLILLGLRPDHHEIWKEEQKRRKREHQIADLRLDKISPTISISQNRWNELCQKLELDDLSGSEAGELYEAVVQRYKQAREEDDAEAAESLSIARIFVEARIRDDTRKRRKK